jgi:hypothetical protein
MMSQAYHRTATTLASSVLINKGKGQFILQHLPTYAQMAPVFGIQAGDFDLDGNIDLLLSGNFFGFEIETGRADAFRGLLLLGDGKFNFKPVDVSTAGFRVPGDGKALARIERADGNSLFIATQNSDKSLLFRQKLSDGHIIKPVAKEYVIKYAFDGKSKRKVELYWGDGYLSQSSRSIQVHRKATP